MQYLKVKNHDLYQHYGDRNPPWVKLYRVIMGDYDLRQVSIPSRLCFIYCTILASETDNRIPFDCKFLTDRMGFVVTESVVTSLIDRGLLLASGARRVLASTKNCSSLLSSSESLPQNQDLKSKTHAEEFEQFWLAYPRKVGKKKALHAWNKAKDRPEMTQVIRRIDESKRSEQWLKEDGQFIPHPSTWINDGRWDDEPMIKSNGKGTRPPPPPPKTDPIGRGLWGRTYGHPKDHGYD